MNVDSGVAAVAPAAEGGSEPVLVVTEDGEPPGPPGPVGLDARRFLFGGGAGLPEPVLVRNQCANRRPYSRGYYTSLIAEARGLRVEPSVEALVGAVGAGRQSGDVVGLLADADSALAPSNPAGLLAFEAAVARQGLRTRRIAVGDPLDGLCALLVRATTAAEGPVMETIREAAARGLALLEPPAAVVRCCDKAFQAVRLAACGVPTPRTLLVDAGCAAQIEAELGLPCVLKLPDSSGGHDVVRVEEPAALRQELARLGAQSAVLVAQAWTPSPFDWRIGLVDGEVLFAARYQMVPGHWQIHLWQEEALVAIGPDAAVPLTQVPAAVLRVAVAAAQAVGGGLLGIDIKELSAGPVVMEVNDTPTIFREEEDRFVGELLYDRVVAALLRRMPAVPAGDRMGASRFAPSPAGI